MANGARGEECTCAIGLSGMREWLTQFLTLWFVHSRCSFLRGIEKATRVQSQYTQSVQSRKSVVYVSCQPRVAPPQLSRWGDEPALSPVADVGCFDFIDFGFSISGIDSQRVQRGINPGSNEYGSLSHCSRFVFLLRAID